MGRKTQTPAALGPLVESFIMQRQVLGRSASTIAMYEYWLRPLAREAPDTGALDSLAVTRMLSRLRERNLSPFTVFQAYSATKIFCRWLVGTGALRSNPCDGLHVRPPRTLPEPPTAEEIRKVLAACDRTTFEGARNYAIVLTLCDSGARRASLLRLLVQDWNPSERSLFIRKGKGDKDNVAFVGPTTARAIRDYLLMRPPFDPFDFLFVDARNRLLKGRNLLCSVRDSGAGGSGQYQEGCDGQ